MNCLVRKGEPIYLRPFHCINSASGGGVNPVHHYQQFWKFSISNIVLSPKLSVFLEHDENVAFRMQRGLKIIMTETLVGGVANLVWHTTLGG